MHQVRLTIKPYDRGVFFSPPMGSTAYARLLATLTLKDETGATCGDYDKLSLLRQAAMRNYFTSTQVSKLLDAVSLRENKIKAAVLLHPRTTDQANFAKTLGSLESAVDRQVRAMCLCPLRRRPHMADRIWLTTYG